MNKKIKIDWALFIASIALMLSLWIFYRDYIKPFNLSVRASGRLEIAKNPYTKDLNQDCLLINLIFSNNGAKRGVVEDVAIYIKSNDKSMLLRSLAIKKERTLNLTKELPPPKLETFLSFNLAEYEDRILEIMFIPFEDNNIFSFEAKIYRGDIWIFTKNRWQKCGDFSFSITADDIKIIAETEVEYFEDGSYFVKWKARDMPLSSVEDQLKNLKRSIEE